MTETKKSDAVPARVAAPALLYTAKCVPLVGDYISGRCVTMNTMHDGQVLKDVGRQRYEFTTRFLIRSEDGREYIVTFQQHAFRPSSHTAESRINAAAWATYELL